YGFDYLLASLFGAVTPFCTCSSIPLFIGFIGAGIPLGVTFAFLITSPLINEIAVAMFIGLFGWRVTAMYVSAGLIIGMVGGYLISRLKLERYVEGYIMRIDKKEKHESVQKQKPFSVSVLQDALHESWSITRKVAPYVLLGVGVGAVIHGYVPEGLFEKYVGEGNIFAVPLAVVLAVPLYASAHSIFPVVDSLVTKGVPLGTALAFMMATVGLSLPEALILRRAIKMPLLLTFFGIVTVGIVLIGYIFNLVL
ncbi:MAG: permease, partial [Patescibacteria group bacterium]|nr:permease [Patescibacteria group bacterium]